MQGISLLEKLPRLIEVGGFAGLCWLTIMSVRAARGEGWKDVLFRLSS